jgi:hypothetical protein
MTRCIPGVLAVILGFAFVWVCLLLWSIGLFCFDGAIFSGFHKPDAFAPDCFLVRINVFVNPQIWLAANLVVFAALAAFSEVVAIAYFKRWPWAGRCACYGLVFSGCCFLLLGLAFAEFRTLSAIGVCITAGLSALAFRTSGASSNEATR